MRSDTVLILSTFNPHIPCELAKKYFFCIFCQAQPSRKDPLRKNTESNCVPTQCSNLFPKEPKLIHEKSPKSFLNSRKPTFGVFLVLVVARTNILTHRNLLHTNLFKNIIFFIQRYFQNRNNFEQKPFHTTTFLHAKTFTHRVFFIQNFYTQKHTHTEISAHRSFYTSAGPFTHRPFCTHTLSHAEAGKHKPFQ